MSHKIDLYVYKTVYNTADWKLFLRSVRHFHINFNVCGKFNDPD